MATKTRSELIRSIEAAIDTKDYRKQLEAETLEVLTKLNTLPGETVLTLLIKACKVGKYSGLKSGLQPEALDCASVSLVNVLLYGPPGRGKSQLASVVAERHVERAGGILQQIVCPEDTQVSILAGAYQPADSGRWQWVDGPVTRVLRTGGALIADELAHLSPEACTWLLAALDNTKTLTLPSGETFEKRPMFVVSTQNDTPASLLPALADRHPIQLHVSLPFAWDWLGEFAPLAERDLTTSETASLRPWAALRRMTDAGVPYDQSVKLLWPDSPSQLSAIKLALDSK